MGARACCLPKSEGHYSVLSTSSFSSSDNPFNPLYRAILQPGPYSLTFGTRHHTTKDSHRYTDREHPYTYNDRWGTGAALHVSKAGKAPLAVDHLEVAFRCTFDEHRDKPLETRLIEEGVKRKVTEQNWSEFFVVTDKSDTTVTNLASIPERAFPVKVFVKAAALLLLQLSKHSAIKVGGWASGMKDIDFFDAIGQISPVGEARTEFYGNHRADTFTMKDDEARSDFIKALTRLQEPLVKSVVAGMEEDEKIVLHWDGDELWDSHGSTFNNYAPAVWALAANLHRCGRLEALLCVKNSRTKWNKAIGSEPDSTPEDKWYRNERPGSNGEPRQIFATCCFQDSKIADMLTFIRGDSTSVPDLLFLTHSTEKNKFVTERQEASRSAYFPSSVQSAMALGAGAKSTVVMFGGGEAIYNELSNENWTGAAKQDKFTKGYKEGTKVFVFDVLRKAKAERCQVFEEDGEPETIPDTTLKGKVLPC